MGAAVCSNTGDGPLHGQPPTINQCKNNGAEYSDYGNGPHWTTDCTQVVPPRFAKSGLCSEEQAPSRTLMDFLTLAAQKNGANPAFMIERPCPELKDGKCPPALPLNEWKKWTYKEYLEQVRAAAKGFISLGFQKFDSVNIWGFNSPEWMIAAIASGFAGGKVAGLYPTDTPDAAAYKVVHSGGSIVVVEDRAKLDKLLKGLAIRGDAKRIKAFIAYGFEPAAEEVVAVPNVGNVPLLGWQQLIDRGNFQEREVEAEMDKRIAETQAGNCAALIYTSGTTGEPKAVMISHDNISCLAQIVIKVLNDAVGFGAGKQQERIVSYLPLSHVAGMMIDVVSPIALSALTDSHTTLFFARVYDLKAGGLKDRLVAAEPTLFLGVPLVWEKIADKIRAIGAQTTGLKKTIATWAKAKGAEKARDAQMSGSCHTPAFYGIADKLVMSKAKESLGLHKCKYGMTGAAPIRLDTQEYFGALGMQINEVYGMSEAAGASTISTPQAHMWGSVGWELPGTELRVFKVDEVDFNKKTEVPRAPANYTGSEERYMGEICWRGRGNMMGYMANPDFGAAHVEEIAKKNATTIDSDGWLHSGDKGLLTTNGLVRITGRYKELIIGEGGENIAPVPIEDNVKKLCDGICEIMMVGDKRKYNVALVTLKAVGANGESPGTDQLDAGAVRVAPGVKTISEAMKSDVWIEAIKAAITATNKDGKLCTNNAFTIQKFSILPTNFSEEGGELTPTKKLKRKVVEDKFKAIIDKLYATDGVYIAFE
eukprot:TRINITY_DN74306_c0_g1_i1.p1 TRINITY_DN74306_c0_g1~~TRINITY_DN74306_c0_g1_i1.p1  ORF type:complete len:764 (+),score=220.74 TRINITY_DN74306_c0_g1_i1:69-2360(+)